MTEKSQKLEIMKNKTIANWLIGTLAITVFFAFLEADESFLGTLLLLNWAWVIVAIVRLYKQQN